MLPVDLDNVLSVDAFASLIKGRGDTVLTEETPGFGEVVGRGPEGRYHVELIVPFVRRQAEMRAQPVTRPAVDARRVYAPGSEWLDAKRYTGTGTADRVLVDLVAPVVRQLQDAGAIDRWFFLRYGDPDWHVRLRLHGPPEGLAALALPALHAAAEPLFADGRLRKLQLDTYERELERYGGAAGIEQAERLFHADSEAVLGIVELLAGDAGQDARWRLTLRGMDQLLDDLGLALEARHELLARLAADFAREHRADKDTAKSLGDRFRKERTSLEALLDRAGDAEHDLAPGLELFAARSELVAPIAAELRRLPTPVEELAGSFLHMHANRLLRAAARTHEMVVYDFLERLYKARLVRSRS